MNAQAVKQILVRSIFQQLAENSIRYCILRNWESITDGNRFRDIDISIDKKDSYKFEKILHKSTSKYKVKIVSYNYSTDYLTFIIICSTHEQFIIQFDLHFSESWLGLTVAGQKEVMDTRILIGDIYISSNEITFLSSICMNIIGYGGFKAKYIDLFTSQIKRNSTQNLIKNKFGTFSLKILKKYANQRRSNYLTIGKYAMRTHVIFINFRKNPALTLNNIFHYLTEKVVSYFLPHKKFLCFVGPDGCGKSTLIHELVERLCSIGHFDKESIKLFHFRPKLFPNIKTLFTLGLLPEKEENFTSPHRAKPSNNIISLFRLIYYATDYLIGYYVKIIPLLTRGNLVIFDRYFYDLIVDPRRSRINLPASMRKTLIKTLPAPTCCFFVATDDHIIYQRKQEIAPDEISRINQEYRELSSLNNFHTIQNNSQLAESVAQTLSITLDNVF